MAVTPEEHTTTEWTGSQKGLIIFSNLTDKPIHVENYQKSCFNWSRQLTQYILSHPHVSAFNIKPGDFDFSHNGVWYRNSKYSPAQAEEYAMERAAKLFLDLPDDEAIFADKVRSDGDTRGSDKVIKAQNKYLGHIVDGVAEHEPDIGHFFKTLSNGLYALAKKMEHSVGFSC